MIQFNLLPDVKLRYVKTQRVKHLLTLVSVVASVAGIAILVMALVTVYVVQKKSLNDLNKDISSNSKQLKSVKDLEKILTVQNQLNTLPGLHDAKPVASRLFGYMTQVTPSKASLSKLTVDFTAKTMTVGGKAESLDVVSTYTDTLKATKYAVGPDGTPTKAFTNVVLSSFGKNDTATTFNITFTYDDALFLAQNDVKLLVPQSSGADQSNVFGEDK